MGCSSSHDASVEPVERKSVGGGHANDLAPESFASGRNIPTVEYVTPFRRTSGTGRVKDLPAMNGTDERTSFAEPLWQGGPVPLASKPSKGASRQFEEPVGWPHTPPVQDEHRLGYSSQEEGSPPNAGKSTSPPPTLDDDDPWTHLQAKYKPNTGPRVLKQQVSRTRKTGNFSDDDEDDFEMLEPGKIDDSFAVPNIKSVTPSAVLATFGHNQKPQKAVGPPKGGSWGNGELAAQGTLMMGALEDVPPSHKRQAPLPAVGVSNHDAPMSPSSTIRTSHAGGGKNSNQLRGAGGAGAASGTAVETIGVEDFEDVDALLASEMEGSKMGDDLAKKLAKYEEEMRLLGEDD